MGQAYASSWMAPLVGLSSASSSPVSAGPPFPFCEISHVSKAEVFQPLVELATASLPAGSCPCWPPRRHGALLAARVTALGQYLPRQRLALSVPGLTDLMGLRPSRAKIFERSDLTDLVEADDGRLAGSWPPRPTGLKARYPSPAHCPRRASRLGLARLHLSVPPYLYPHSFVRPAGNDALRGGGRTRRSRSRSPRRRTS